jgi:hypothetical protein
MDGLPSLIFIYKFFFHFPSPQKILVFFDKISERGGGGGGVGFLIFNFDYQGTRILRTLKERINGPLSLQSYASDVMVCNPLVKQILVHNFTTQKLSMINNEH